MPISIDPLLILSSARRCGDTEKYARQLFINETVDTINLLDYSIFPYDYEGVLAFQSRKVI